MLSSENNTVFEASNPFSEKRGVLIYASETEQTKKVAYKIEQKLAEAGLLLALDPIDFIDAKLPQLQVHDFFIFGCPTWNIGELQADLEENFDRFDRIDFDHKPVAIYGLGDQVGYPDTYQDAMAILADKLVSRNASLIGKTSSKGHFFERSLAEKNGYFLGLALDEDTQSEQTDARIDAWIRQLAETLRQRFSA